MVRSPFSFSFLALLLLLLHLVTRFGDARKLQSSTTSDIDWTRMSESAWDNGGRSSHASVKDQTGSLYVMGGKSNYKSALNDVWRSTNNGTSWSRATEAAAWPEWHALWLQQPTNSSEM